MAKQKANEIFKNICRQERFSKSTHNMDALHFMFMKAYDLQQAEIDRLMLEFCSDEMTPEQVKEWSKHQRVG